MAAVAIGAPLAQGTAYGDVRAIEKLWPVGASATNVIGTTPMSDAQRKEECVTQTKPPRMRGMTGQRRPLARTAPAATAMPFAVVGATVVGAPTALTSGMVRDGGSSVTVRDRYHDKQSYPSTSCTYRAALEPNRTVRGGQS